MSNWDNRWLQLSDLVASWSKDKSIGVGAVIVNDRNVVVGLGWNGFPRGIDDEVGIRHTRPLKYKWTEHAERNAIYNAAAEGHPLKGCTIYYNTMFSCSDCARAIIQSGIKKIVCREPDWKNPRWAEDFQLSKEMLDEAKIEVKILYNKKEVSLDDIV